MENVPEILLYNFAEDHERLENFPDLLRPKIAKVSKMRILVLEAFLVISHNLLILSKKLYWTKL